MTTTMNGSCYTITDLAHALGLSYSTVWAQVHQSGKIPKPDVTIGRSAFFSEGLYEAIVDKLGVTVTK